VTYTFGYSFIAALQFTVFLYCAELFPTGVRNLGVGVSTLDFFFLNFLTMPGKVQSCSPENYEHLGEHDAILFESESRRYNTLSADKHVFKQTKR